MRSAVFKSLLVLLLLVLVLFKFISPPSAKGNKEVIVGSCSLTITWVTDKPSTSQVEYGTTTKYTHKTPKDSNLVTKHKVTISGLIPSTTYHYRVRSKDAFGNESLGNDRVFTTLTQFAESQPPRISDVEAEAIVAGGPPEALTKKKVLSSQDSKSSQKATKKSSQLIKKEEPIEKALIEKGGILLSKGKFQIEPSTSYVHTSANRLTVQGYTILPVLVVGEISTENVKRDFFIETLTARYGLLDDLQLEVSVPYRYQHDRVTVESPASDTTRQSHGIGDVSAGIFHQLAYEDGFMPDTIVGLSVKSRTGKEPYGRDLGIGTGHWGIKGSVVAVRSSDPAIIFASLGYTYNVERNDIDDYGTVKPGDTFDYSLGAAFALNYQLALSMQLQQSITRKMRINESYVPSSFTNVVNFKYGFTWSINENLSCDVAATHGLSADSPDFVLEVSFPYTF